MCIQKRFSGACTEECLVYADSLVHAQGDFLCIHAVHTRDALVYTEQILWHMHKGISCVYTRECLVCAQENSSCIHKRSARCIYIKSFHVNQNGSVPLQMIICSVPISSVPC